MEVTARHFLVSESRFASRELAGLDEAVELFAIDPAAANAPADEIAAPWGKFWTGLLENNALHGNLGCTPPPEEGGLLLRPIRHNASSQRNMWAADASRFITVPPRTVHKMAGWPLPVSISNETFIELRYSLPPSVLVHFDFADLREGVFRAFAVPMADGDAMCRLLLVLDPEAVHDTFTSAAAARRAARVGASKKNSRRSQALLDASSAASSASSASSRSSTGASPAARRGLPTPAAVTSAERLERFLAAAAGAPPSAHWSSTVDVSVVPVTSDALGGAATGGGGPLDLFPHQRRSVDWMHSIESAGAHTVRVEPIAIAERSFGSAYSVELPVGGVLGHPPGAGKTRIAAALLAERPVDTLILCPGHLVPYWQRELCKALDGAGKAIHSEGGEGMATLLGYHWSFPCTDQGVEAGAAPEAASGARRSAAARILLVGYHSLSEQSTKLVAEGRSESSDDDAIGEDGSDDGSEDGSSNDGGDGGDGSSDALSLLGVRLRPFRLIVDEPQDICAGNLTAVYDLAPHFRVRWLVCGTAAAHLRIIGPLLLGARPWRMATTVHEWRGQPSLPHVYRHRFLRDPSWACLPQPPLEVIDERVTPSQEEAVAAQMAALSGYVVDSVLLLSFGQRATAMAVQERQQLARQSYRRSRRESRRRAAAATARHEEDAIHRLPPDVAGGADARGADEPRTAVSDSGTEQVALATAAESEAAPFAPRSSEGSETDESDESSESGGEMGQSGSGDGVAAGSVGGRLMLSGGSASQALPVSEWTAVEAKQRQRLARVEAKLRRLRQRLEEEAKAFVVGSNGSAGAAGVGGAVVGGVLERLSFLQADALTFMWTRADALSPAFADDAAAAAAEEKVAAGGGSPTWQVVASSLLAGAEWNADLAAAGGAAITGRVVRLATAEALVAEDNVGSDGVVEQNCENGRALLMLLSESEAGGDFCAAAWRAHRLGAVALLVACDGETTRPMGYASEQLAPPIPAAMLPHSAASALLEAAESGAAGTDTRRRRLSVGAVASLKVLEIAAIREDAAGGGGGVDEGMMADIVALDDATSQRLHTRWVTLESERERLISSLRFASRVQCQLSGSPALGGALAPRDSAGKAQQPGATAWPSPPHGQTVPGQLEAARDGKEGDGADLNGQLEAALDGKEGDGGDLNALRAPSSVTPACPICFEQPRAVCVLPECFHTLCRTCLQRASAGCSQFRCPLCRARVLTWTVTVFRTALATEEVASALPAGLSVPMTLWRTLPSKLQRLLTLVNQLLTSGSDDDDERGGGGGGEAQDSSNILIYTQWLSHVDYVYQLLKAANIDSLHMSGDLGHCMHCLQRFGTPGAPRVLVLSSQHHASGINLQCARHVILIHPYCTPSATYPEAVSFASLRAHEQQAIGRVRRYPQTRTVRVHRLFAADTVEALLYRGGYAAEGAAAAEHGTRDGPWAYDTPQIM